MEIAGLLKKLREIEEKQTRCATTTGHLFQEYRQQLSEASAYVCLHCGQRVSEEDRRQDERARRLWTWNTRYPEKPRTYLPLEPEEGTFEWYQKHVGFGG